MTLDQAPISLGVYSVSPVVQHLLHEQFQDKSAAQLTFFEDESTFAHSLHKRVLQGYLLDRSVSSPSLYFSTFLFGKEKKETLLKPFRLGFLLEKLSNLAGENFVEVGPYIFNKRQRFLTNQEGVLIPLREKEAAFLLFLLKSPGQKADRQTLLQHVWGYAQHTETHTLETHVYHLRQKIEPNPGNPEILINEGAGYRLSTALKNEAPLRQS